MSVPEAIGLNNEGVVLFLNGDFHQAFYFFAGAYHAQPTGGRNHEHGTSTFRFAFEGLCGGFKSALTIPSFEVAIDPSNYDLEKVRQYEDIDASADPWEGKLIENNNSVPFLFVYPISISVRKQKGTENTPPCPCRYSWVTMYNLALVCSVNGMRRGVQGRGLLEWALRLYGEARRHIRKNIEGRQWGLMNAVILNNTCCILRDMGLMERSISCSKALAKFLRESPIRSRKIRLALELNVKAFLDQTVAEAA